MIKIDNLIKHQINFIDSQIDNYEAQLRGYADFEDITLHIDARPGATYYTLYSTKTHSSDYVGKRNDTVIKVQERKYIEEYLSQLRNVRAILTRICMKVKYPLPEDIEQALDPAYKGLPKPSIDRLATCSLGHKTTEEIAWLLKTEEFKKRHPSPYKDPKNRASTLQDTRSKGEALCLHKLDEYNIAYVFECPLFIGGKCYYPDFTIFINGKVFIWEHLGRMYKDDYFKKQIAKLCDYAEAGFIPGTNLFFTFDDPNSNIDVLAIENVILNMINIAYAA